MQICSRCHAQSPNSATRCVSCQADLAQYSTTAQALQRFQNNPRVTAVRISVSNDACPACQQAQGTYPKDQTPRLPIEGCSNGQGCRCFYDPILNEIFP